MVIDRFATFLDGRLTLVTGATGFVGRAVVAALDRDAIPVREAVRSGAGGSSSRRCVVGEIGPETDWAAALAGVDTVIHLAARVHVLREHARDPQRAFHCTNVEGTERLARAAAAAGVRRLVYASSVKVNGESTVPGSTYDEGSPVRPEDPYGASKAVAEERLRAVSADTRLEFAILRPPLMYGPGVKGNVLRLLGWVSRGLPLPFAGVKNRRSLLGVDNFASALIAVAGHPAARNATFMVRDGEDVSTPELVRLLARSLGREPRLFKVPARLLRWAGALSGRSAEIERLTGSLRIDDALLRRTLDWQPPRTLDEGLADMARWYGDRGLPRHD